MSSNLGLSGLASGVDTNSIIQQLLALERGPQNRLKLQQSVSRVRQDALRDVSTRLRNLENAARDLRGAGLWADTQTAESTDSSRVAVTRLGPGGPGGYQIDVSRLARAEQRGFTYSPQESDSEISIGGATIKVAANSDIATVAATINSTSGAPAYAAVVSAADGGRQLVLSSRTPGAANGFSASGPSIQEDPARYLAGADAQFTIDGVPHTSPTNVVSDAIPGLQLTLKGVTGANPVAVNVSVPGPDLDAIKAKLRTFVDQYNSTVDFISGKLSEEKIPGATSEADAAKGVLRGDTGLGSLLNKLRTTVSSYASGTGTIKSLSALGISTGGTTGGGTINQDSLKGKLTLDDGQLAKALAGDPIGVGNFLGQAIGDGGFAREIEGVVHSSTQTGGTLDNRISQEDANRRRLTAQIADMDRRLQAKQDRLKAQYAAMETALSKGQTHGQWLSGQLQALSNLHG
jgi:flagellar hook-associated protein 2